ncbi:MAG: GNAT family N-acetyltransferase [Arcicella sp.]|nr:GNAT family N-acetyltransferase [Arcicella sp.]
MITKAIVQDIPELNILVNSAYRGESSKKGWTTEEHLLGGIRTDEEGLLQTVENKAITILKYTENDKIIGTVSLEKQGEKLYLGMLTVSPELQDGGVGKQLLKAAEDFAKEARIPKIVMTVISVRTELIAWYERHGYIRTGENKPFPMNDPNFGIPKEFLEFVVLEKKLI